MTVATSAAPFARPKSVTCGSPSASISTFDGLRSRWITPSSCAYANASATAAAMRAASSGGSAPRSASRLFKVSPVDQLGHQVADAVAGLARAPQGDDARVVERRDAARLAPEALRIHGAAERPRARSIFTATG